MKLQIIIAVLSVTSLLLAHVKSHPQCLNFMPPFKPEGSFQLCNEYDTFGCCNADDDKDIAERYNHIISNFTEEFLDQCGDTLKTILCQKCSPYAAHIYDSEDDPKIKSFPGLCTPYCKEIMENCSALIELATEDKELIQLSKKEDPTSFCMAIRVSDRDYCYPKLKTNRVLTDKIGTAQFYQKRTWRSGKPCLAMCVQEIARGLYSPVSAKHANDGTNRLFVVEQRGVIWVYMPDNTRLKTPFLDIKHDVEVFEYRYDERGLLDIVFHPDYKNNGLFYIYYSTFGRNGDFVKLSEMKVSTQNMNKANASSERKVLTIRQPAFNHNGGQLLFNDDGYLYITSGDGGRAGDPFGVHGNGQNKKVLLGKVLRIDVNSRGKDGKQQYGIPPDNPFVNNSNYRPEIYALGVRNMWRCSIDRGNKTGGGRGRIICGDVGQGEYEEVDIIEKGGNYGWRAYEGHACFDNQICNRDFVKNYVPPIHVYNHSVGKSITGGYVYRGCQNPNLDGKYIFGDFSFGKLFTLTEMPTGRWRKQNICMASDAICKNGGLQNTFARYILSFGEVESGEIYMLTTSSAIPGKQGGVMYKLVDPSRRGDPSVCLKTSKDEEY